MHVNAGSPSEQRAALVGLEPCPDEVGIAVLARSNASTRAIPRSKCSRRCVAGTRLVRSHTERGEAVALGSEILLICRYSGVSSTSSAVIAHLQ
jgi:hypothetical protein